MGSIISLYYAVMWSKSTKELTKMITCLTNICFQNKVNWKYHKTYCMFTLSSLWETWNQFCFAVLEEGQAQEAVNKHCKYLH